MKELIFNDLVVRCDPDHDTVWLNQKNMADLFGRDRSVIAKHIENVFREKELPRDRTCANFAQVQNEGDRVVQRDVEFYNLDVILAVGYRVKSPVGTHFRQWATAQLREILMGKDSQMERERLLWQAFAEARTGAVQLAILGQLGIVAPALPARPRPAGLGSASRPEIPAAEWWRVLAMAGRELLPADWLRVREEGERVWVVDFVTLLGRLGRAVPLTLAWARPAIRRGLLRDAVWLPPPRTPGGWEGKSRFPGRPGVHRVWLWREAAVPAELRELLV